MLQLIDQRALPHRFVVEEVTTVEQMAAAIRDMHVRGAGLIGAALLTAPSQGWAHHSFSAEFDVGRPVNLAGTVKSCV